MQEKMKDVFMQQPSVSEPGSVSERKVKIGKRKSCPHKLFCNLEYVFYICEKTGEKCHFVIFSISAECTMLEDRFIILNRELCSHEICHQ